MLALTGLGTACRPRVLELPMTKLTSTLAVKSYLGVTLYLSCFPLDT